jgi:hypothetical protein
MEQVPLKTVGVLCAVNIFGKNIETRHTALSGKRYLHNAVESVVNYVLNPMLPSLGAQGDALENLTNEQERALQNIRDCFNFIFHIQVEYFKTLNRLRPERFQSKKTGERFHLNTFAGKAPTLINSEKRYLILAKLDGVQPFSLDLDWNAEFVWPSDEIRRLFRDRLFAAQEAYAGTLRLGEWYSLRDRTLIIPLKTIMDDLSEYFDHLAFAAYLMARNSYKPVEEYEAKVVTNLRESCRYLERFALTMLRMNLYSVIKHDISLLDDELLKRVIQLQAEDDIWILPGDFDARRLEYADVFQSLYQAIGFTL